MLLGVLVYFRHFAVVFPTSEEGEDRSHNTVGLSARIYNGVLCPNIISYFLNMFNCTLQLRNFMQVLQLRNVTRRMSSRILEWQMPKFPDWENNN